MGTSKVSSRQATFIAGMKGPQLDPVEMERRLAAFLKSEARLDDAIRQRIFAKPEIRPKAKLANLVRTYKPGHPQGFEKSETRELVEQCADLLDELASASEQIEKFAKALEAEVGIVSKDSAAHKLGEQCLAYLSKSNTQLKKSIREIKVPKADGAPEATLKSLYGAASAGIMAALLVAEIVKAARQWRDKLKAGLK